MGQQAYIRKVEGMWNTIERGSRGSRAREGLTWTACTYLRKTKKRRRVMKMEYRKI